MGAGVLCTNALSVSVGVFFSTFFLLFYLFFMNSGHPIISFIQLHVMSEIWTCSDFGQVVPIKFFLDVGFLDACSKSGCPKF